MIKTIFFATNCHQVIVINSIILVIFLAAVNHNKFKKLTFNFALYRFRAAMITTFKFNTFRLFFILAAGARNSRLRSRLNRFSPFACARPSPDQEEITMRTFCPFFALVSPQTRYDYYRERAI